MFLLSTGTQVANDMNLRSRVAYAMSATSGLKSGVEAYHTDNGRFPARNEDLGASSAGRYPDGGYYELEDDGVIRIHFEVRPELTNGSIVLTPVPADDRMNWQCLIDGNIEARYLPAICRS